MYTDYIPVIVFIGLAIALLIVPLIIQHLLSPRHDKGNDKLMSYECGEVPEGSAWVKFNIRFYIIALVFIIFDVEVVFLFPWAAVYQDFIAAGKYLIKNGITNEDHLFAEGGSAGGLLIGAVVNMEPEMWKGAIAAVPFVDVITTMLDSTIPLTTGEWDEWGDPRIKKYYDYMLSYSPYDQIQNKSYPNLLVTSGFFDSQVQYWEPLKYVAKLREHWEGPSKLYLHMNMDAGHGGKSGRYRQYREVALEYAFMFDLVGIKN